LGRLRYFSAHRSRALGPAGPRQSALRCGRADRGLEQLGTDLAIDYKSKDPIEVALGVTNGNGVDVVLDTVGGDIVERSLAATRKLGRVGTILGPKVT
jgi:NADPH2:quinone reductase